MIKASVALSAFLFAVVLVITLVSPSQTGDTIAASNDVVAEESDPATATSKPGVATTADRGKAQVNDQTNDQISARGSSALAAGDSTEAPEGGNLGSEGGGLVPDDSVLKAFPGAEGFGSDTVGGRGGDVIEVTTLDDSGPGSLRAALEASGPRTVVFRVGGTITLDSRIVISNPYVTIAGQTAPGDGILIRGSESLEHQALVIQTHDVIIRYLRIRPGASDRARGGGIDGISIEFDSYNVIIDHCSLSWTTDEVASVWHSAQNVTFQWNIFAEGLDLSNSGGEKSKGPLLGEAGAGNISFHHNLTTNNHVRNPMVVADGIVDVRNNVVYNSGNYLSYSRDQGDQIQINYVNNYAKSGPHTGSSPMRIWFKPTDENNVKPVGIYVSGNIGPSRPDDGRPEADIVEPDTVQYLLDTPHNFAPVVTHSALEAYDLVLDHAGATLPKRDSVDVRLLQEVRNGGGQIISDPSEVGGWPQLAGETPAVDTDRDGMPDAWEQANGFDPNNDADGKGDKDGDGYTNLEEYLNQTST